MKLRRVYFAGFSLISSLLFSCKGEKPPCEGDGCDTSTVAYSYISNFSSPQGGLMYVKGDKIPFKISFSDGGKSVTQVDVFMDNKRIFTDKGGKAESVFELATDTVAYGAHSFRSETTFTSDSTESTEIQVLVVPKQGPEQYSYKVVTKYPHDVGAYTQGLVFENGMMYEGTGQLGRSEIRYVDFKQNKVIRSQKLNDNVFGEGVAIVGDKAYQLSWQNRKGFVYDKNTFKLIKEFNYTTEGWGLTYDGTDLILSDGSSTLYFYEPENFTLKRKLVVFDNQSDVNMLNELEYIEGEIWANVYQTDKIVRIDPKTGLVKATLNLDGLLTMDEQMNHTDVLNGIAYDAASKKIYVTGKLWPWVFEVVPVKNDVANK